MTPPATSRSFCWTAQWSAVVPSASGAFTLTFFCCSIVSTAALSLDLTASTSGTPAPAAAIPDEVNPKIASAAAGNHTLMRISLNLRKLTGAITELFDRNPSPVEQSGKQVRKRRVLRISQVLPAFDLSKTASDDRCRQRGMVVR